MKIHFIALALMFTTPSFSNIFDIQKRSEHDAERLHTGNFKLKIEAKTGNSEVEKYEGELTSIFHLGKHEIITAIDQSYGTKAKQVNTKEAMQHLRHRFRITELVNSEVFIQHAFNEQQRLLTRNVAGIGPRFDLFEDSYSAVFLGMAYLLEAERLGEGAFPDAGEKRSKQRLSSYLYFHHTFKKDLNVSLVMYYQPLLSEFKDYRILSELGWEFKILSALSFELSLETFRDSLPPDSVKKQDMEFKNTIKISF
ncbi:MAG: DUF481 domain-containing protein [Deltaproteobacteria bacterium]|nr:DUF481 domain-containing protein [Deltaproteobacteria bacterium]